MYLFKNDFSCNTEWAKALYLASVRPVLKSAFGGSEHDCWNADCSKCQNLWRFRFLKYLQSTNPSFYLKNVLQIMKALKEFQKSRLRKE